MTVKVAINGFGRIGRNVLRAIVESGRTDIEVVAINDLGPVETNAHLIRYDSVHGKFPGTVTVNGDTIDVGRGPIKVTAIRDPKELPWGDVDIAMECTGIFTARDKAAFHLENGSKRVLVSAPCFEAFAAQPAAYREAVLGTAPRVGVEAAVQMGWEALLGSNSAFVGMSSFGASAPADELYQHFGITADAVADAAKKLI